MEIHVFSLPQGGHALSPWLDRGRLSCSSCLWVTKHQGELQPAGIQLDFVAG